MKITANIATHPPRKAALDKMLKSIEGQFDEIRIYDNGILPNLTDNGKFYFLKDAEREIYFTLDDDLIYPQDYVEKTVFMIEKYNCIVTYHGRVLLGKGRPYYKGHKSFRCLNNVDIDTRVDVAGTGVTAFDTDFFKPTDIYKSEYLCMGDLVFSLEAAKQQKSIMLINHRAGWLKQVPVSESIYAAQKKNATQGRLADQIYDLIPDWLKI